MGKYKVIYLEDSDTGEVLAECPVCKKLNRNVIEPVALIVEKSAFPKNIEDNIYKRILKKLLFDNEKNFLSYKFFKILGISKITDKILNKDDLVCIFHQKKEGKHWEEDTKEFKNYTSINIDENNLISKFWERIRAYRFAIDYWFIWNLANNNWDSFYYLINNNDIVIFKNHINNIDFRNSNLDEFLIEKYFQKLISKLESNHNINIYNYDFRYFHFPYFLEISTFIRDSNNLEILINNFWYKEESPIFIFVVDFSNSVFNSIVRFSNIRFQNEVNFSKAIFNQSVNFSRVKFNNGADFSEVKFYQEVSFSDEVIFDGMVNFSNVNFYKNAFFYKITFKKETYFSYVIFDNGVSFSNTIFKNIVIFHKTKFNNNLGFYDCDIFALNLDKIITPEKTYLEIKNSEFNQFILKDFINYSENFLISNIKIKKRDSNIKIENSILNNLKFINCNFSKAKKIEIKDSYLEETIFANVNWGEISEKRICPNLFEKEPDKARDIYRQIKLSLDKQADYINANWFYALEMKAYENYLYSIDKNKTLLETLKVYLTKNFQDKLIFSLHKTISNFGQSLYRPLFLIILSTFFILGFAYPLDIDLLFDIPEEWENMITFKQAYFIPIWEIITNKNFHLPIFYISFFISLIIFLKEFKNDTNVIFHFLTFLVSTILSVIITIILLVPVSIILKLNNNFSFLEALANFLDNFATTLNIFNVFKIFSKNEQGNFANAPHYFSGYYFIYI